MINFRDDNIKKLMKFYKEKGNITLVGLNDSQLINVTNPWGKGSIDLLAETFEKEGIPTNVLNAGSAFYNKAEHGKSILENNLTVKEIQLLNSFSYLEAYSKVFRDIGLPFGMPKIFERAIRTSFSDKLDPDTKILDVLVDHPVVITSFMANNIMRAVANNPFNIKKDYENRNKTENFNYTLSKIEDERVLEDIIETTKRTYDVLLSKTNGQVYGMGFFLPNGMAKNDGLKVFEGFIDRCNEVYKDLCETIGVNYLDVSTLGTTTGNLDFHAKPDEIKNVILSTMANHVGEDKDYNLFNGGTFAGLAGVKRDTLENLNGAQSNLEENPDDLVAINTKNERETELRIVNAAGEAYNEYLSNKSSKRSR